MLHGSETPRLFTPPARNLTPETSLGFEAITFAADVLGIELMPWQRWLLIHALELKPDGSFRFRYVIVLVARQNGKTLVLNVLTLWRLFMDGARLVIGTAQNLDVAEEAWAAAVDMAEGCPELAAEIENVIKVNGKKALELSSSRRYKVQAANRRGGRGLSGELVALDELREHRKWDAWAAVTKTTMAKPNAQVWGTSNAGDEESVVLRQERETALTAIRDGDLACPIGLFEWSALEGIDVWDRSGWAAANPALGTTITEEALAAACAADPEPVFRTECLCQWVDELDERERVFPKWASGAADIAAPAGARMALGMDTSWNRASTWIVAAAELSAGRVKAELVATGPGTGWVREWLFGAGAEPSRIARLKPVGVAMQASGAPVSTLYEELCLHAPDTHRETIKGLAVADMARASGLVFDLVDRDGIVIVPHEALDAAADGAVPKPMSDAWVIDRKRSESDAAPLVALSAAVAALTGHVEPDDAPPNCW